MLMSKSVDCIIDPSSSERQSCSIWDEKDIVWSFLSLKIETTTCDSRLVKEHVRWIFGRYWLLTNAYTKFQSICLKDYCDALTLLGTLGSIVIVSRANVFLKSLAIVSIRFLNSSWIEKLASVLVKLSSITLYTWLKSLIRNNTCLNSFCISSEIDLPSF